MGVHDAVQSVDAGVTHVLEDTDLPAHAPLRVLLLHLRPSLSRAAHAHMLASHREPELPKHALGICSCTRTGW